MTAHLARHTLLYLCHSLTLTFGLTLQTRLKLVRNKKTHTASRCCWLKRSTASALASGTNTSEVPAAQHREGNFEPLALASFSPQFSHAPRTRIPPLWTLTLDTRARAPARAGEVDRSAPSCDTHPPLFSLTVGMDALDTASMSNEAPQKAAAVR